MLLHWEEKDFYNSRPNPNQTPFELNFLKISLNSFNRLAFLQKYFKGDDELVVPFHPVTTDKGMQVFRSLFQHNTFKEDFRSLNENIRDLKESIPPLIKSYMSLSSTMQCFGACANPEFGPVEEIAILITIADIYEEKRKRHVLSYNKKQKPI